MNGGLKNGIRADDLKSRAQRILTGDKFNAPDNFAALLKSDAYALLREYMEIDPEKLSVTVDAGNGGYAVKIYAECARIKNYGRIIDA